MTNLITLAERVEAATCADRELDREIAVAVEWSPAGVDARLMKVSEATTALYLVRAPAYTTSRDAAMALLPDGCGVELDEYATDRSRCKVHIWSETDHRPVNASAATAPLALTAACLRARASL